MEIILLFKISYFLKNFITIIIQMFKIINSIDFIYLTI